MKLTNEELFYAGQGIRQLGSQKFPLLISLKIAKLTSKLNKATKPIEKQRKAIVSQYNQKSEKDGKNQPNRELQEAMENEINELMEQELEFNFDPTEKIDLPKKILSVSGKLGELEDFKIESNTLALLLPFLED